jgi:hypothetical protein
VRSRPAGQVVQQGFDFGRGKARQRRPVEAHFGPAKQVEAERMHHFARFLENRALFCPDFAVILQWPDIVEV